MTALLDNKADFILIGGTAMSARGSARVSKIMRQRGFHRLLTNPPGGSKPRIAKDYGLDLNLYETRGTWETAD